MKYLLSFKLIISWFIFEYLKSFVTNFDKKIFIKSEYLINIITLLAINKAIKIYLAWYIYIFVFKKVIYIINAFFLRFKVIIIKKSL